MHVSGKHTLIVDDNQEILDMISLMLERQEFKISAQSRVGDFIHDIRQMRPDLILMDKNLSWVDCCHLCALIKTDKELQHISVIMFSAYHKLKEDCLVAGADTFFQKPFVVTELLEAIHSFTKPGQVYVM